MSFKIFSKTKVVSFTYEVRWFTGQSLWANIFRPRLNRTNFTDTAFEDTNSLHSFLQCQEILTSDFTSVIQLRWVILKLQAVNQEEESLGELLLQELIDIVLHGYLPEHLIWSISFCCNLLSLCPYLSSVQLFLNCH